MDRIDLMTYSGVIKEYKPESRWASARRRRRRMRYIDPPYQTALAVLETLFWMLVAGAAAYAAIAFPVMFVKWWLCA